MTVHRRVWTSETDDNSYGKVAFPRSSFSTKQLHFAPFLFCLLGHNPVWDTVSLATSKLPNYSLPDDAHSPMDALSGVNGLRSKLGQVAQLLIYIWMGHWLRK